MNFVDPEGLQPRTDPGGGLIPPPPPPSQRPPGYPPAFGDLVPGDKCLKCDWDNVAECMLEVKSSPGNVMSCWLCSRDPSVYNPACWACGGGYLINLPDCLEKYCREGSVNSCGQCE